MASINSASCWDRAGVALGWISVKLGVEVLDQFMLNWFGFGVKRESVWEQFGSNLEANDMLESMNQVIPNRFVVMSFPQVPDGTCLAARSSQH